MIVRSRIQVLKLASYLVIRIVVKAKLFKQECSHCEGRSSNIISYFSNSPRDGALNVV